MARSLNKVILIGNVGKAPNVRYTSKGDPVATFPLATSEVWRDKDGNLQERTDWHNIVAWRKLAEIIQELVRKGSRLFIEGRIQTRSFEDRSGDRRYITEIVAENMLILDGRNARGGPDDDVASENGSAAYSSSSQSSVQMTGDDDLPF